MRKRFTFVLCLLAAAFVSQAQNQITTPSGQPLVIGNQGVKMANLNSSSPTQPANGKVLSVDAAGLIYLAPASSGGGGGSSPWASSGSNISFTDGNVGIGTSSPLTRLDVNGDINLPSTNGIRFNNVTAFRMHGVGNLFVGFNAGNFASMTGTNNVAIGGNSGENISTGSSNTFIGKSTGTLVTSGRNNVLIGNLTGSSVTMGVENTMIGERAGYNTTIGSKNIFIGKDAGLGNVDGYQNVFIGHEAKTTGANAASLNNAVAIGYRANVSTSNSMVLGGTGFFGVNVGIGTTAPQTRLHIVSDGSLATGVRFENLATTNGSGAYRLYVDASGNVLRHAAASAREAAEESSDGHWTLTADDHLLNANAGGVLIGTGLTVPPAGYKLYVSDGILTERVKVAVKSTADWRDQVLAADYKLRSVEEVASYINQKGHLPGVPSAQEMVQNGNDLHQTDAILLEKIEEMMLYIIELKKENRALKGEVAENRKVKAELVDHQAKLASLLERVEALEEK